MNAAPESAAPSVATRSIIERLIAFNTVSRDSNLGLIEWVRDYLHQLGATTRLTHDASGKKANLFATLGDSKKPGLILSGHTDVVPVDGQNWDTDPFVAVERDGKLYARGSADMKGFIGVALAQAPKFVAALNANRLDAPLHYALSYDEEVGCLGVRGLIRDLEENGIRPAGCVVGEPTSMQPIIAHKGTNRFRCAVHGREAHSSYVTYGVNAIEYAARLVVFIRQIADRLAQFEQRDYGFTVPYTTLSTGVIRGGIAANVIPKDCEFQFDMRTLPQASADALYQEIRALCGSAGARNAGDRSRGGHRFGMGQPDRGTCGRGNRCDRAMGDAALAKSHGGQGVVWNRSRLVSEDGRCRRVICGPGDIAEAHRPNEFVALEQLAQCEAFMERILETGYAA